MTPSSLRSSGVIPLSLYGGNAALTSGTGDDLISIQVDHHFSCDAGDGTDTVIVTGAVNNSTITGAESLNLAVTSTSLTGALVPTIAISGRFGKSTVDGVQVTIRSPLPVPVYVFCWGAGMTPSTWLVISGHRWWWCW